MFYYKFNNDELTPFINTTHDYPTIPNPNINQLFIIP